MNNLTETENKVHDILSLKLGDTSVFRVKMWRSDTSDSWWASAELRDSESNTYATSSNTLIGTLIKLENVLLSLVCPTCGVFTVKDVLGAGLYTGKGL